MVSGLAVVSGGAGAVDPVGFVAGVAAAPPDVPPPVAGAELY